MHIENKPEFIDELFKQYVTVIEIPFSNQSEVNKIFEQIKKIHFQFIRLKYDKDFKVDFQYENDHFTKENLQNCTNLFSAKLNNPEIKQLALDAGIDLENPQVAFYIKDKPDGLLYNYLPTEIKSPFPYIDFHADFHTTVDRKNINFDSKIGKYNTALFCACIELYFMVLNSYADKDNRADLNLQYISEKDYLFEDFNWNLVTVDNNDHIKLFIRQILKIHDYKNSSKFFGEIAKKYFSTSRDPEIYDTFYNSVQLFIHYNATNSSQYNAPILEFKKTLAKYLRDKNVKVLPELELSERREILYRKSNQENNIELPDFLGITITDYEIDKVHGSDFKQSLGIKNFSDYNEILKYYKQCNFTGEHSLKSISEEDQKKLLESLFTIYRARNDRKQESTHRFITAYDAKLRQNNSTLNQANFNIATVFLKTKQGKYKPAQLCLKDELDMFFLKEVINTEYADVFLTFIGVSIDKETVFADSRIYDKLKNGLDFIPGLISVNDRNEEINDELIINFSIITKGKKTHAALVNDNGYKFLDRFYSKGIRANLENLLAKKYSLFPKEYRTILKKRIDENLSVYKDDIIRLYQSVFNIFLKDHLYLVLKNGKLEWTTEKNFTLVNNKHDFDLISSIENTIVLCYYSGSDLTQELIPLIAEINKGKISVQPRNENKILKYDLQDRMVYLLINISYSSNTEMNFLEDDKHFTSLQKKMENLIIYEGFDLRQEISFNGQLVSSSKDYAYDDVDGNHLYFSSESSQNQRALGIAEYLFSNPSLKDITELILFYKSAEDLEKDYDQRDIAIITSKWKKDYDIKLKEFNKAISDFCEIEMTGKWYIYNSSHISEALVHLQNNDRLIHLQQFIYKLIQEEQFVGYFDDFILEIDYSHIEETAAELISFLEQKNEPELLTHIKALTLRIGSEDSLNEIRNQIIIAYPEYLTTHDQAKEKPTIRKLELERKIDHIFKVLDLNLEKQIADISLTGDGILTDIRINTHKTVFHGSDVHHTGKDFEFIGSTGEEQILIYFIKDFLKLSIEKRIKGVNEVYNSVETEIGNNKHEVFKNACLNTIDNDQKLSRNLIPLFYVTMHHKYAGFDLIVYKDEKPTLVEVKTTNGNHNRFFLSDNEINIARRSSNYEMIRVSKDSVFFIGNPIKLIESKLKSIEGNNFTLTPRKYEFNFSK